MSPMVDKNVTKRKAELPASLCVSLLIDIWIRRLHVLQMGEPRVAGRSSKSVEEQISLPWLPGNGEPVGVGSWF